MQENVVYSAEEIATFLRSNSTSYVIMPDLAFGGGVVPSYGVRVRAHTPRYMVDNRVVGYVYGGAQAEREAVGLPQHGNIKTDIYIMKFADDD